MARFAMKKAMKTVMKKAMKVAGKKSTGAAMKKVGGGQKVKEKEPQEGYTSYGIFRSSGSMSFVKDLVMVPTEWGFLLVDSDPQGKKSGGAQVFGKLEGAQVSKCAARKCFLL